MCYMIFESKDEQSLQRELQPKSQKCIGRVLFGHLTTPGCWMAREKQKVQDPAPLGGREELYHQLVFQIISA